MEIMRRMRLEVVYMSRNTEEYQSRTYIATDGEEEVKGKQVAGWVGVKCVLSSPKGNAKCTW